MKKSLGNYFTTGELAKACRILRKTLLYYDKLGVITPEVILDNGYRYYKRTQLFLLELIVTLRQLGVSLTEIQTYLSRRSPDNYRQLLVKQQQAIAQEITRLQYLNQKLDDYLADLQKLEHLSYGVITEETCGEKYLFVTKGCKAQENFKARSLHAANLFLSLRDKLLFKQHVFGYIVDKNALFDKTAFHNKEYFYPLEEFLPNAICRLRPAGTYLTLYFQGVYMHHSQKYLQQLGNYCSQHNLTPLSDIYVTSLLNYWTTTNTEEYAYRLEVRVK